MSYYRHHYLHHRHHNCICTIAGRDAIAKKELKNLRIGSILRERMILSNEPVLVQPQ